MNELCIQADWDDNQIMQDMGNNVPDEVLDARESILRTIIRGSALYYLGIGKTGYGWVAKMFSNFLDGNGNSLAIQFQQGSDFVIDPGIVRATRSLHVSSSNTGDDPDIVIPLMLDFMLNYVRPKAWNSPSNYNVGPVNLYGAEHYFTYDRDTGLEPRAYDNGYWAAFGHVTIDGQFSGEGKFSCTYDAYLTDITAKYHIDDAYHWFPDKRTPLPIPGVAEGQEISTPHLWWISLTKSNPPRAHEFDLTIDWTERHVVYSANQLEFRIVPRVMFYLP